MKTIIAIVLAAGVGFAAAYGIVSHQKDALLKQQQAQWKSEKEQLDKDLAAAQKRSGRVERVMIEPTAGAAAPARITAQEWLDRLIKIQPGSGAERITRLREVIFCLGSLAETGQEAVPVIGTFLARNEDVNYSSTSDNGDENDRRSRFGGGRRSSSRLEFTFPPSLRIGLFDVLKQIGGEAAEKVLADTLGSTGRGVEVAYLDHVLETMAPGKYRDLALTAAKDLLTHPPTVASPDRLDENSEEYLFGILEKYKDSSFASIAAALLIKPNGQLDRAALRYLDNEQSVPVLYQAYNDSRLTNQFEKANIASRVLNYAGLNQQANQLFNEVVSNTNTDSRMRSFAIIRLAGGDFGPFSSDVPKDPQVIQSRINLLNQLQQNMARAGTLDQRLDNAITGTIEGLNKGEQVNMSAFFGNRGGDNSNNSNRGGNRFRGGTRGGGGGSQ